MLNNNKDKIERYLDELSEEYKELLLKRLLENSTSIENLNVSDLLRIDTEIKKPLFSRYRKKLRNQRIFLLTGLMYIFIGIMMLVFFEMLETVRFSGMALSSMLITLIGVMISLFTVMFSSIMISENKNRLTVKKFDDYGEILEYNVVKTWRELEGIAADIYPEEKRKSTYSLIDVFLESGNINYDEANELKEFLRIRNSIVHSIDNNYGIEEINNSLKNIDKIIKHLREIV